MRWPSELCIRTILRWQLGAIFVVHMDGKLDSLPCCPGFTESRHYFIHCLSTNHFTALCATVVICNNHNVVNSELAFSHPSPGASTDFSWYSGLWPALIAVSIISLVIMTAATMLQIYAKVVRAIKSGPEKCMCMCHSSLISSINSPKLVHLRSGTPNWLLMISYG